MLDIRICSYIKVHSHLTSTSAFSKIIEAMVAKHKDKEDGLHLGRDIVVCSLDIENTQ